MAKQTRRRDAKDTRENGFESLCAYGCVGVSACMGACVYTLTPGHCKVQRSGWSLCIHTHTHTTHTCIHIHIYWLGGGVRFPSFFGVAVTFLCFISYTCARQGTIKPDASQFPSGCVSRRYPDYAQRAHAVLCREGGSQDLGLRDSRGTVPGGFFTGNRPPVFPPRRFTIPPMYHERGLNSSEG